MPILLNGEVIRSELIRDEERLLAQSAEWQAMPECMEKTIRLREAAEWRAIDRLLLQQEANKDARPIDPSLVSREVEKLRTRNGCRIVFDDARLRLEIESQLRVARIVRDLGGGFSEPTGEEIARFYNEQRHRFRVPEAVHARHIVKNVDEMHPEEEARAGIEAALADLERGEPFAQVAERYSDCKGNGGDLGFFERGVMVTEFEDVVFGLKLRGRSPIFRTPFGFHIAEVMAKIPAGIAKLRDVKDTIRGFLVAGREQQVARLASEKLRSHASIRRISANEAKKLSGNRVAD